MLCSAAAVSKREGQGQSHTVGQELGGLQARKDIHRGLINVWGNKGRGGMGEQAADAKPRLINRAWPGYSNHCKLPYSTTPTMADAAEHLSDRQAADSDQARAWGECMPQSDRNAPGCSRFILQQQVQGLAAPCKRRRQGSRRHAAPHIPSPISPHHPAMHPLPQPRRGSYVTTSQDGATGRAAERADAGAGSAASSPQIRAVDQVGVLVRRVPY